jgi:hypothetical protein
MLAAANSHELVVAILLGNQADVDIFTIFLSSQ